MRKQATRLRVKIRVVFGKREKPFRNSNDSCLAEKYYCLGVFTHMLNCWDFVLDDLRDILVGSHPKPCCAAPYSAHGSRRFSIRPAGKSVTFAEEVRYFLVVLRSFPIALCLSIIRSALHAWSCLIIYIYSRGLPLRLFKRPLIYQYASP